MSQKGDLMTARSDIRVLDATIRDGGLVNNFEFTDEFINALQTIVIPHKNINIYPFLDELSSEQIYRSRESVYKYIQKKNKTI